MNVKIRKLDKNAIIPRYASEFSAGADLYSLSDTNITIESSSTVLVHTGISIEIPDGYVGLIYARSGLATKRGLAPANCVGVIDSDYRGEIMVALHNNSVASQTIEAHERIAQLVIAPYIKADFTECDTLNETERGSGGFGSSGRK